MASQRALYWIAVALMALFLGNHFAIKYDRCLRVAIQSSPVRVVEQALAKTPDLAPARRMTSPVAAGFASMQAELAHQQAAYAILEAKRARIMAMEEIGQRQMRGICPRHGIRIAIPERPARTDGTI
jgi:hypothetical protein